MNADDAYGCGYACGYAGFGTTNSKMPEIENDPVLKRQFRVGYIEGARDKREGRNKITMAAALG